MPQVQAVVTVVVAVVVVVEVVVEVVEVVVAAAAAAAVVEAGDTEALGARRLRAIRAPSSISCSGIRSIRVVCGTLSKSLSTAIPAKPWLHSSTSVCRSNAVGILRRN